MTHSFPTRRSSDLLVPNEAMDRAWMSKIPLGRVGEHRELADLAAFLLADGSAYVNGEVVVIDGGEWLKGAGQRSEEHTSELQSLMRISYAVFCLKKKIHFHCTPLFSVLPPL